MLLILKPSLTPTKYVFFIIAALELSPLARFVKRAMTLMCNGGASEYQLPLFSNCS